MDRTTFIELAERKRVERVREREEERGRELR